MDLKPNQIVAQEILDGKWGNGTERRERLTQAGYNYEKVQSIVNALVYGDPLPEEQPQTEQNKPLEIDYDPQKNEGIIVNIIV